jgi:hypothetical protein
LEKNSKIGTNFEIGFFFKNGTNYELEQISKMKRLSNWKKFQNWNNLRIEMNFEFQKVQIILLKKQKRKNTERRKPEKK